MVEAGAALPRAAQVVAGVVAAAEVGIVTEEGAHRGAAGLGHVPVNHSPTLPGRILHRSSRRASRPFLNCQTCAAKFCAHLLEIDR